MTQLRMIRLSPSSLSIFLQCPRCFWLDRVKLIKRPRGIFPSLPGGMDRVIKTYFDGFRSKKALPPELRSREFPGIRLFEDQARLDLWRNWKTGPVFQDEDGSILTGALDDLLVHDGLYVPFDYKTKGSTTTQDEATRYYQNQLDCYALLLDKNGMKTADYACLLYFSPLSAGEGGRLQFEVQPIKIGVDPGRALAVFHKAVALLKKSAMPPCGACEYCEWLAKFQ